MFLLGGGLWLTHRHFLPFYLTSTTNRLYYNHGGQKNDFYLCTYRFCSNGRNLLHYSEDSGGYKMNSDKLWLLIDSTHKKLLRARFWTTSLDDYKQDIEDAIKALEKVKQKMEKDNGTR